MTEPTDARDDALATAPPDLPPDLPRDLPRDLPSDLPCDLSRDLPSDLSPDLPRGPAARRRDPFQPALSPLARRAVAGGLLLATAAAMAAALAIWNGRPSTGTGALAPATSPATNILIPGEAA
ncbi:hypothetical protein [Nonomuraea roseoviolacea]|uniref:Uncharacterized protein n=1 Tax=Nonomuraea roseoviolacea subsp. carminata TaxID=160689 RepID=A0ABT1KFI4_9ACTN|nr:hypothetical protein [Nonomuraea roseoviolacea]MCP2352407.1 hypothetical protein [Nonomuraea roseoviolacea subsp. carminata]